MRTSAFTRIRTCKKHGFFGNGNISYAGEMKIVEPEGIREAYAERLQTALDDALAD